jgi:NAD-dependent dihydropyrimidine dehydrogenase PreA subunit
MTMKEPRMMELMAEHLELARTLRKLKINFDPDKCSGIWECIQVCPVDCWEKVEGTRQAVFARPENCIACKACVLQCPEGVIKLWVSGDS